MGLNVWGEVSSTVLHNDALFPLGNTHYWEHVAQ